MLDIKSNKYQLLIMLKTLQTMPNIDDNFDTVV